MSLTNLLAALTLISLALSFWKAKDGGIKENWKKFLSVFAVGVCVFVVTLLKNAQDSSALALSNKRADSTKMLLDTINHRNATINAKVNKIDTLHQYLKRLDSIGVKRDSVNNRPIISKTFTNTIETVNTLNQY